MGVQETIKCRQKRKEDLVYLHNGKCGICGYNKTITALEFHHINSEEKEYGLSNGNTRAWLKDVEESKKCILLCANCHREVHAGLINFPLITTFNQERFEELQLQKEPKIYRCEKCGKFISKGARFCVDCAHESKRIAERPSREQLKELIRTKSFLEIGRLYGVSDNAIRKWCKTENLPYRKQDINAYSDEEWNLV